MSNLILNDNVDTLTFNRVDFNNPKSITNFNIIGSKNLIVKADVDGNPVRLDYSLVEVIQSNSASFQIFADRNAGLIVDLKFEGTQYFGYIESYNISAKRTKEVTRSESSGSEIVITTADETTKDIDFTFTSLNTLPYEEEDEGLGLSLL